MSATDTRPLYQLLATVRIRTRWPSRIIGTRLYFQAANLIRPVSS